MSTITAIVEAGADGTLHLPLPAGLRHGKVIVMASGELLSVVPEPVKSGSWKGFGALKGKLSMTPLFPFRTTDLIDCPELPAFLTTSAVVGGLVSRVRKSEEKQKHLTQKLWRRQAYLVEAQKLSYTSNCGRRVSTGEQCWSDETIRILRYAAESKP